MDGKVASKLWLEITLVVRRWSTFFSKVGIFHLSCCFHESVNLHCLSERPNDLLGQKVFIQCLLYHQVSNTEDKKMYENRMERAPACIRSINEMLVTLKIAY